jgi:membrane protein
LIKRLPPLFHDLLGAPLRFRRHNGLHLCAGVAFYALLSVAPLTYLCASLFGRLLRDDDAQQRIVEAAASWLPTRASASFEDLVGSMRTDTPLFWLAIPALAWAASSVFASLDLAVNIAFERSRQRRFAWTRLKAFALIGVGLVALWATTLVAAVLPGIERLAWEREFLPDGVRIAGGLGRLFLLVLPFALFTIFYKILPRGNVSLRDCAMGASLTLLLWQGLYFAFGMLVSHSPALGLVSGSLAAMMAVLLWVYSAVVVVMLGAEFAAIRAERREEAISSR